MTKPPFDVNHRLHGCWGEMILRIKDADDTRRRLLAAAKEAFATVGYQRAGLREIAKAAGVNFALIQRYFGGKEGLFEQALLSVMDVDRLLPRRRSVFGSYMADLLTGESIETLPMMLFSLSSLEASETSLRLLQSRLHFELAAWLGQPAPDHRATKIMMICSGFVTHLRLLPLAESSSETLKEWLCDTLQAVVDER